MIKKMKLQDNKGIIVSDAIVSILIILLFSGVIISLITNIVLETKRIKINSQELDYITEIFEYVEKISYDDATEATIIQYINNKSFDGVSAGTNMALLTTPYKIEVDVTKYNETTGNESKLDLIKTVTVTVKYTLNQKDYVVQSSKLRKRTTAEIEDLLNT